MEIQHPPVHEQSLSSLPSLRIDTIHSDVPLDDRLNADRAFNSSFVDSLKEGMTWYLSQRGLRMVGSKEELRVVGTITDYEGNRGWGDWGAEISVKYNIYAGSRLLAEETIRSVMNYSNDSEVVDEEEANYESRDMGISFLEILFTRIGVDLSEKLITYLKGQADRLGSDHSPGRSMATDPEARGSIAIESSVENAEVIIDGKFVGSTPVGGLVLQVGTHRVEVRKRGFIPWIREITVLEASETRFFADLVPEVD